MATPSGPTHQGSSNPGDYFPETRQSFPVGQRLPRHQRAARSQTHLSQPVPTRIITRPDDLSDQEKFQLKDLMEEWIMSRPVMDLNNVTVPDALFCSFLIKVFELWNSNITGNPLPSIPERTAKETSIMVGTLRESHPPSKKRKHGQESTEIQTSRLAGAPIYWAQTLQYGEENIRWMWRDSKGQLVNQAFVQLNPGLTRKQAKINLMNHYDACERLRAENFNSALIICLARRRIFRFARREDSRVSPRVHSDDCAAGFVKLELTQDVVHGMWDDVEAMKNEIESTRSNETEYVL